MTWDEVKQKGSRHYKTGRVEPIDLFKHTKPDASLTALDIKALNKVVDAINKLKSRGFKQNQIRCYVLIGFDMREEHDRLIELLKAGCLPFAQLYQPEQKREYDYNGNSFKECGADQRYTNH